MAKSKAVRYELMYGREASEAIGAFPVGYLPIGCLERHGDHLPMGLDAIKAHEICCAAARTIGGLVFPPHYYAGIHNMTADELNRYTGEWGNLYTDRTAKGHLVEVIHQIARAGIKLLVLYSGHYPESQRRMVHEISAEFADHPSLTVMPFYEPMITPGDHAGISETSLMLYLDPDLVDMTRIREVNYQEHGWREENSPERASHAKGEQDVDAILSHLKGKIEEAMKKKP